MARGDYKRQETAGGPLGGRPGGPMAGMMGPAQKPRNFKGTMRALLRYMRPYRRQVIIVLSLAVASTAFTIVSPKILGNVTNDIVTGYSNKKFYDGVMAKLPPGTQLPAGTTGEMVIAKMPPEVLKNIPAAQIESIRKLSFDQRPGIDYNNILRLVEFLILLYLVSAMFNYLQSWIMSGVSQKVTFNLRRDIAAKMNRLPLRYYDTRTHGEVLSRVTNDVDTISQTLNQSLVQLVTSATALIGILVMMFTISWQMTLVALVILPISFGLIGLVVRKSQGYFVSQQKTLGQINGHVEEMFSGHTVMKAFNGEARSIDKFAGINDELYKNGWRAQFYSGLLMPIMSFVGNLSYVGVAVVGGWMAINGKIRIGDIQAFIQYMNQFTQPIMQTANIANVLQSTAAAAERVFEFLNEQEEVVDVVKPAALSSVKGGVSFDHVMFGYTTDKPIIREFTADILPGQKVAIVGPTGAGKTTLVNLLMRFYDVDAGAIKIDGVDIREMKRADLRSMFGMVLQDSWLFSGSIEENIAYGKPELSNTAVVAAAEAAHADHFIRSLPGGYQMKLNEEADNISQGEKQLLTIARVMLADAPMLILDEATSSVDTRTELLIQKAMDQLMQGRTSFIIAHRLSTIKNADLILVMKDGSIVEQGKHEELLSKAGYYASLYNSQFALA
ncbi:MAG: ABC transporter ATP-binding protein [Chitinophagaceae bacterium]|nr:MAG: ABC transporter ATP-binding protein [Chitinophagaceae bacterium]